MDSDEPKKEEQTILSSRPLLKIDSPFESFYLKIMSEKFTLHDQHIHTCYSVDSKQDMKDYIDLAISKGCKYFVMTDHYELGYEGAPYICEPDVVGQKEELDRLQIAYKDKITLLQGIEIGYEDIYKENIIKLLESHDFDLINLSVHNYREYDFYRRPTFDKYGIINCLNLYYDILLEAVHNIDFDVLAHIDYAFKAAYLIDNSLKFEVVESKLIPILKYLIENGKCLEINTKVQEYIKDENHIKYLLNLYYSLGGRDITISSDAHKIDRYLSSFEIYKDIAKEIGFNYLCYFVKRKKYQYFI